jgi:ATP-dependent DNA helicase UvrD/PcrA
MDFLNTLNPRQKEAVLHTEGPLLILAGAGSGKTRVIISRIAYLICGHGVPAGAILAVTFTNKAAEEMRNRVGSLLSQAGAPQHSWPTVSTFHSFCVRLLRAEGEPLADLRQGFTTRFAIYDENDQVAVVKSVYRDLGIDEKFMKARAVLSIISHAKNQGRGPHDFYRDATHSQAEKLAVIFERYQQALVASNAFDFDDLLLESVRLLRHSKEVRARVNERYHYVMVDEYQDTNRPQYDLMRLLTDQHRNVCVVGDEDQSIYSWRGADIRNILDFERDYPNATVIRLEQNYRSTKRILAAAGAVVANNLQRKGKDLWTQGEEGSPILLHESYTSEQEALFVAGYIDRYLREHPDESAAALYRTNSQSRQIEEALRRCNRKYLVVGGVSFYKRAEVKDLTAYLRLAICPSDAMSFLRVINTPARGIGKTTIDKIDAYAQPLGISLWEAAGRLLDENAFPARTQTAIAAFRRLIEQLRDEISHRPLTQVLAWLMEQTGYQRMLERDASIEAEGRLENLNELSNAAADADSRGEDIHAFLDHAALVADTDQIDNRAQVLLMTLHSAKGLEFPLVALMGLEENIFPHSRSIDDSTALEEERRLCYVGMTRARRQLVVTRARTRRRWGGGAPEAMMPSRFLREIPRELVEFSAGAHGGGSRYDYSESQVDPSEMDLLVERHDVRDTVEKRLYPGRTYNSVENVAGFFAERGLPFPGSTAQISPAAAAPAGVNRVASPRPPAAPASNPARMRRTKYVHSSGFRLKGQVRHPKFGLGTILRLEGDGDDTKLTVHFERYGLKKMVAKYAGLQPA